ncbi:hypothetical protein I4U23_010104 [Adineta vaga]|nr:hypothetical protein I4U23_010104 [Adineta vaga]
MNNRIEEDSESDDVNDEQSGSEIENDESQTTDADDEIDLEDLKVSGDSTRKSSYTSKSGMIWSSISSTSTKTKPFSGNIEKSGPTKLTENIASIEDAFICLMSEKILQKILIYSNMEYERNIKLDEKEEITMLELKASIGLLLLAGLLGRSRSDLHSLWKTSPLESPIFKATISKSRFDKIIACLRFDDKSTREERKKQINLQQFMKSG